MATPYCPIYTQVKQSILCNYGTKTSFILGMLKNGLLCLISLDNIKWYNIFGEFDPCKNHIQNTEKDNKNYHQLS
jgi:hypothetical protein